MSQYQFHHGSLEEQVARIQRFLVEQSAGLQAPGSGGGSASPGFDFSGQLPEAQVAFDDTSGHDHSSGNGTAVPMAGAVTGTNQAAVVTAAGDVTGPIGATVVTKATGNFAVGGNETVTGSLSGFTTLTPGTPPTITGSRGANAALASLLTGLATLGVIIDATTV